MSGALHRRVVLDARGMHVSAAVEDDFHHFALRVTHDGTEVTGLEATALRNPWASCPSASAQLQQLVGTRLDAGGNGIDHFQQCTHQYDLALMALAQALRGGRRDYLARVSDPVDGRGKATLERDGQPLMAWSLDVSTIVAGTHLVGANLRKLDIDSIDDAETAEAVKLLRRSVMVAGGRGHNFDQYASLAVFAGRMTGACFAFQAHRLDEGLRVRGSVRDFSGGSTTPLAAYSGFASATR
ncbi:MAG: DUF2889 domain-containing protein [Pseudomonadota bacterium]